MSIRVSTVGNYSAVLANLMAAQKRQIEAGDQVATQKKGDDLKDYAKHAEMLTAMRAVQTRVEGYLEQNLLITDKLATQDEALNRVTDAARNAREVIAEALASGRADTLMEDLNAQMRNAVDGMNARYGGKYVFAGGQINTEPVTATSMSDLTAPPAIIANFFQNDTFITQAKVDDATTVSTGLLASDLGTDMLTALQTIQTYHQGVNGPLTGPINDTQRAFLESQLQTWDQVREDLTTATGRNGLVQKRVESVKSDLISRTNTLKGMTGGIVDADMAEAYTRLQQAQISVQAAAQVFATLQQTSLLTLLR